MGELPGTISDREGKPAEEAAGGVELALERTGLEGFLAGGFVVAEIAAAEDDVQQRSGIREFRINGSGRLALSG